ncbi:hypothetical protein A4A49_59768 [Nicotiana attenuata]|uniref:RNase H type-1 domain-containing protein n=1 Tax=Nicotiana attenuata TaxID=49451 RepID=A0A1J6I739_NICAT|nr:hypothetical protein A4A49_59768 [Nicotiana attenuata]
MEILALFHGVKLALTKKLLPLVIETDCLELLNLLKSNNCLYQNLIDNCRYLLRMANDPHLDHIFREANGVADLLAKNGCSLDTFCNLQIFVVPPVFTFHVLKRDSLGTMWPRLSSCCNNS